MGEIKKSALLKTSSVNDVLRSGGNVSITGLFSIRQNDILDIRQIKYKTERVQVVTVGASLYTPTASTTYKIQIINPQERKSGWTGVTRTYAYTTPPVITTLGATAALQREAITGELVTKINADASNNVVAASLLLGTGFTITDDAGYFPANVNGGTGGRKGASNIIPVTENDGTGFVSADVAVTTTAIYGFGVGTRMAQDEPVFATYLGQNMISGVYDAPRTTAGAFADAGQRYDAFTIDSLGTAPAHGVTGQTAHTVQKQIVFVDNGTGTVTTNLAGFKAFEREMHRLIANVYSDPTVVAEFFDKPIVFQDPLGAAPTGTANTLGWQLSPYTSLNRTNIGTQTIVAPVLDATGLLIDQDDTAGEGSHTSANEQTLGVQQFVVGQQEFSVCARIVMGDWTDSHILVGFRKKAVYTADYNDYTDLAAIGSGAAAGDTITTTGILNNAATVATASSDSYTDAVSAELLVTVDINGTVSCYVNGTSYPIYSVGTTALVLDAGDVMIPFYQHVNIGNGNPAVSISKFMAIPSATWKI